MKKINVRSIVLCLLILLFIVITSIVILNNDISLDKLIYDIVNRISNDKLRLIFKIITFFASTVFILIFLVLSILLYRKQSFNFILLIGTSASVNLIIKYIIKRDRPLDMIVNETGYSYPSGHSNASACLYGFIIYLIVKSKLTKKRKIIFITLLTTLILLIGISRMYLKVHYLTDVLGGFILGLIILLSYIIILEKMNGGKNVFKKEI